MTHMSSSSPKISGQKKHTQTGGSMNPVGAVNDDESDDSDETSALAETAHIPDRDQIFRTDEGTFPSDASPYSESWSGDLEEAVEGDRDFRHDLTQEIAAVSLITDSEGLGGGSAESFPTPVGRLGKDELLDLNDNDLRRRAEVLGVPDSKRLPRGPLLAAIRDALGHV